MASENRPMVNANYRVPQRFKERLELVAEYDARSESSYVRPKLMELYRELEEHPAVQEQKTAPTS